MDLKLTNKIALVSGSTAGIGLAIATALAQEGASVIVNGRSPERVRAALEQIKQTSADAKLQGVAADLATPTGVDQLFQQVPEVDILVNNLGIYETKAFADISDEDWMKIFEVNVLSGVRLSRHYLPLMLKKDWGRIIFISSQSGLNIPAEMIHYGVTKTAQLALARGLAETTAGSRVTVNSVLPGPTISEGVETYIQDLVASQGVDSTQVEREFFQNAQPSSLLKRFASGAEVAALVTFITSPLSSAINGSALRVDGGVVRSVI